MHPDKLLEYLTARQLAEWELFIEHEQFLTVKDDIRIAYLLTNISNLFIGAFAKAGSKKAKVDDFLIDWWDEKEEAQTQSVQSMKEFLLSFAKTHNKKVQVKERPKK